MAKVAAVNLAKQILSKLLGAGRATGRGIGRTAKYGAAAAIGGGLGLGVNPFLGLMAGNAIRNMKFPGGGRGGGITGARGGGAASRDTSIIAGMKPDREFKPGAISKLKPSADLPTTLQYLAKVNHAILQTTLANNTGIIRIQKMLQGPTAARAKELRMESQRAVPVIINQNYFGEGGGKGGGLGLPLLAAAIAGLLGGALAAAAGKGGATSDPGESLLDKAWWDKPGAKNRYYGDRGKYWKGLKAARFMSDFAEGKIFKEPAKPKLGDAFKKWRFGAIGDAPFMPEGFDEYKSFRATAAADRLPRAGVSGHGGKLPYTYKMPLFKHKYDAMGPGQGQLSRFFMSDFAESAWGGEKVPTTTLGKFQKWFPRGPGLDFAGDKWGGEKVPTTTLGKFQKWFPRGPGLDFADTAWGGEKAPTTTLGKFQKWRIGSHGVPSAGDAGMSDAWYADRGQLTLPKGDGAVKVSAGKVTFPRLILDWAPGGLEANWSGGKSTSTTSKAPTGTTATGARIVDIPPGEGLSGRIPYKGARGSFYEGRTQGAQGFTQGKTVLGRRPLTGAEIHSLRIAGLRVSAPAADGVRIVHEFDGKKWKTAGKATINSVIGTQRPALLAHGTQFMPEAMGEAPRFSFPARDAGRTTLPSSRTIAGGGAVARPTGIGTMLPPGEGLAGRPPYMGARGSFGEGAGASGEAYRTPYRGAAGTFGEGRGGDARAGTVTNEEMIRRLKSFEASATEGMSSRVKAWLKRTFGKGNLKRNIVRGFNVAFYLGIVAWYAVRCWMVPKEGWVVNNWSSLLVGEHVKPITKKEFYEKVSVLTVAFGAAIVTAEIVGAIILAIGLALGIAVSAWIVVPIAMIAGAIAAMIAHVAGESLIETEKYKKGGFWAILGDSKLQVTALKDASKKVFGMISGLWTAGTSALEKSRFWFGGMPHGRANAIWKKQSDLRALAIAGLGEFSEPEVLRFEGGEVKNQRLHLEGLMARRDYTALATAFPPGPVPGGDVQGFGPGRLRDVIGGGTSRVSENFLIGGKRAGDVTAKPTGGGVSAGMFKFDFKGAKDWVTGWFKGTDSKGEPTSIKWTGSGLKSTAINPEKIYKELRRYVDHIHAIGILVNIGAESSYRPEAYNPDDKPTGSKEKGSPSGGLCQWHGSRLTDMENVIPNWRKQWQAQIKYIFTEDWRGRATKYKAIDFKTITKIGKPPERGAAAIGDVTNFTPEERAVMWWHYWWEVATSSGTEKGRAKRSSKLKYYDILQQSSTERGLTTPTSSRPGGSMGWSPLPAGTIRRIEQGPGGTGGIYDPLGWGSPLDRMIRYNQMKNATAGLMLPAGGGGGGNNTGGDTTIYYIDEGDSISTASVTNFEPLSIDEGLKNPNIMWS